MITTASLRPWRPAARRAQTNAIRLLRLPPLAGTPEASAPRPKVWASQAHKPRSNRLREGDNSSASRLLFMPAAIKSAAIETLRGGGSRWARAPGWLGLKPPAMSCCRSASNAAASLPSWPGSALGCKLKPGLGPCRWLSPSHWQSSWLAPSKKSCKPGSMPWGQGNRGNSPGPMAVTGATKPGNR